MTLTVAREVSLMRALAGILTTAFLAAVPVTGGGLCPCRAVESLRTPAAPESPPRPACACCRPDAGDQAAARVAGGRPKSPPTPSGPADGPCDHHVVADAAVGPTGERPEAACDARGENPYLADEGRTRPPAATDPLPLSPPRARVHLVRYAHAFRC